MKNSTQGFTLIELLIVIAIIGILAAVLIPNLLGARKRAYDTSAASCAKSLQTAQATFQIDNRRYFEAEKALAATEVTLTDSTPGTATAIGADEMKTSYADDLNSACNNENTAIGLAVADDATGEVLAADIPGTNPSATAYALTVLDARGSQKYIVTANKIANKPSTATERGE